MTTPNPSTTGTVLGEEVLLDIEAALCFAVGEMPADDEDRASLRALAERVRLALTPRVAALLSAAREEGAAAERERIVSQLREVGDPDADVAAEWIERFGGSR